MKKAIELEELKQIELSLLIRFREVCEQNGFNYSLMGGTLLGAVRHKGFIPWDDDIDIIMPRPDYERFAKYCAENETPFRHISYKTDKEYGYLFAKICDLDTVLIEKYGNNKTDMGVYMDIFIYDGMGDSYDEAKKNFEKSRFSRELLVAANWTKFFRSRTRAWYYEPFRFAFFVLSRFVSKQALMRSIDKKYEGFDFYKSKYVGNLCSDKRARSIMERELMDSYTELEFEGELFKVFVGYETYLKNMFGDYMQLPPEDKRVAHHTFDAYYRENGDCR